MNPIKSENEATTEPAKIPTGNTLIAQILSPATGLAVLGTAALIFSFYRAGQLANLVVSKDEIQQVKINATSFKNKAKIDINSQDIVNAVDNSDAAMFVIAGEYKQAVNEAMRDLTDNPPDNLPTILEAGDILSQFGEDKALAFGLLERAISMAPNNQYIALRYAQRFISNGQIEQAEPKLQQLAQKYPQWNDPKITLAKLHFLQDQISLATTEFIGLTNAADLTSRQAEQVSLMLAKLGRTADAFAIFQKAASGEPQKTFYANYCQDWLAKSPESYQTVLAMVKSNLANSSAGGNAAKQLNLEIKHAALLLLLSRPQDAQLALQQAINAHPNNFDLYVLLAATYNALGQTSRAETTFKSAASYYQSKL